MLVQMLTLAASPAMILQAGSVYNLPKTLATDLLKGNYAKLPDGTRKPTRLPAQPDPEDVPELPEDEEEMTVEDDE